jgi:flavin reductase (DIM6/NTAB) family NADH-FMN oxidoreductase RutF
MLKKVKPADLVIYPFDLLDKTWALLVAGVDNPNPMTVSWGGFGTLWNKPMVTVYVRPTRHTWQLLNQHQEFTLNVMPKKFRKAMSMCGVLSGRDGDKWEKAGLHPQASETIAVPRVLEASLSFECRTMAFQDFDPGRFLQPEIEKNYPQKDYHRIFWGEALAVWIDDIYSPSRT